jgi:hypothetical protein
MAGGIIEMSINDKVISDYKLQLADLINSRHSTSHSDLLIEHVELQTELQINILNELIKLNANSTNSTIPPMGDNKEQESPSS